jgi:hypothetical protein
MDATGVEEGSTAGAHPSDRTSAPSGLLSAVREDIRQTLRTAWIDPAIEAAASSPVFFTAAWSAVRPNVGKSFLALARAVRTEAVEAIRAVEPDLPNLRKRVERDLSDEELERIEETVRALHLGAVKAHIVVHAFGRAARRDRVPGTGREESPIKRGVPEWQRWMSFQPMPEVAQSVLNQAARDLGLPGPGVSLRLLARWPAALNAAWGELKPRWRTERWRSAGKRMGRLVASGAATLPHPIDLQWTALKARGFSDEDRVALVEAMAGFEAALPTQTLVAAFLWDAFGRPEIGLDA